MKVIFRTHGGKNVGLGHISRCLSLARAIKDRRKNADIKFIVNGEVSDYVAEWGFNPTVKENFDESDFGIFADTSPDFVVVDSYDVDSNYIGFLREKYITILLDDNAEHNPISSHFLINGNIHAEDLNYESQFDDVVYLLGPEFLIMKPEYWDLSFSSHGEGITITTGGTDFHNLMPRFMEALRHLDLPKRVIIGPMYPKEEVELIEKYEEDFELIHSPKSLKKIIERSKLVITAAGSTVYEVLTLRRIPVIYTLAENQKLIAHGLEKYGVRNLGDWERMKLDELKNVVSEEYSKDPEELGELFDLFDGKGVFRSLERIGI